MKNILVIVVLAISLGGCAGTRIGDAFDTIKSAATGSVSPSAIYIARNAYDAAEVSATNYLNLSECPKQAPFCHDHDASIKLIQAIRSGRVARNNATQFLKAHPNQLGSQGLYDAIISSTDTIKQILSQYHVVGG